MRLKPLHDQVVVITGASSGIGLATARAAAKAGARVFLIARDADALRQVAGEIEAADGEAGFAAADVGDRDAVAAAIDAAIARFGRIDTVVSDAGVAVYADLLATPRDEHERMFRTNYWGAVNVIECAVPHLREGGGALIVVGSVTSDIGTPVLGAYAASKHAVKGYVDSLRIELNRDKAPVSLTLIKPAGISTPLDEHAANHKPGQAQIPPPAYAPEVVARAILRAAVRPFREITVGGVGEAQILVATHFPGLFSRLAGAMTPLLNDRGKPEAAATDNLETPGADGASATRRGPEGRSFSVYTAATTHPGLAAAAARAAGLAVAAAVGAVNERNRRRRPRGWLEAAPAALQDLGRRLRR